MKRMLYMWNGPLIWPYADFNDLEDKGLTDLILGASKFTSDTNAMLSEVDNILEKLSTTDIKLYLSPVPFKQADGTLCDPTSTDYLNLVKSILDELLEKGIAGISWDDMVYPSIFYDAGQVVQQRQNLVDFCNEIQTHINTIDSNIEHSAALYPLNTGRAALTEQLAPCFDFIIPMVYRYDSFDNLWVKNTIIANLVRAVNTPVVPALMTYMGTSDNYTPYAMSDLALDINHCLTQKTAGYALFTYVRSSANLYFPSRYTRSYSNRTHSVRTFTV